MSIKINRALKQCGFRPRQESEILDSVPQDLMKRLTSKELASMMQALDAHWHKAQAAKDQEILGEGCIWSNQHGKLLDLCIKGEDFEITEKEV